MLERLTEDRLVVSSKRKLRERSRAIIQGDEIDSSEDEDVGPVENPISGNHEQVQGDLEELENPESAEDSTQDSTQVEILQDSGKSLSTEGVGNPVWRPLIASEGGRIFVEPGDKIRFKLSDAEEQVEALVKSRAGTARSVETRNRYNVEYDDENEGRVNLDKVTELEISPHLNDIVYILCEEEGVIFNMTTATEERVKNSEEIQAAKRIECENIRMFDTYDTVRDVGQKTISTRWVIHEKTVGGKLTYKARLVARGFEETTSIQSDAPTVEKSTIRIFLSIAISQSWKFESLDVKAAFLQSTALERTIYVRPPKDIKEPGVIWRLKKPLYGLDDSARNWYFTIKEELIALGCKQSKLDKALFRFYSEQKKLIGIFLMHVDDFLFAGTPKFKNEIVEKVKQKFLISKMCEGAFVYIGWNLSQGDHISVDQIAYAKALRTHVFSRERRSQTSSVLDTDEIHAYQASVGKLNWLACQSRPDVKIDVLELSTALKRPTVADLLKANKVIHKVQARDVVIRYQALDLGADLKIVIFTDAAFANLPDKVSSARGHVTLLYNSKSQKCNVISWASNKVIRVCHSTFAAETLSLLQGLEDAVYLRAVLSELLFDDLKAQFIPITAFVDNNQLYQSVYSTKPAESKRLRIDLAEISQMLEEGVLTDLRWIPTNEMIADCLTKTGAKADLLIDVLEQGCLSEPQGRVSGTVST